MRDDDVRSSCFASLDVLCAKFGDDVPYRGGLDAGFPFRGHRVPFRRIHHRAFDQNLVAISPEYSVAVSPRLLKDEDGPMLELLKGFGGASIHIPQRPRERPDVERLAQQYAHFVEAASG